jgi:serine/threonine protein kinase
MASSSTSPSCNVYVVPSAGRYIASGFAADVYQTDEYHIIKRPKSFPGDDAGNRFFRDLVENESKAYERVGVHDGIIKYFGISDESTGAIKLAYANDGDLADYIKTTPKPPPARRAATIRLLSAAWLHIYSRNVSIQDIKTENILVQDGVPKISDFTEAILYPLDANMDKICPKDNLRVDLVGIGCVMYSIAAWEVFDYDYFAEQRWPGPEDVKPTDHIMCGEIIKNCWYGKYCSMNVFHDDVISSLASGY